ncbi:unnamed protein product [Dovyalis caffra]|uniref:Uncharacterized protein n=1 Tax=Dovyalis caffra TaxID=77055 RepID=A0AAV1R9Z5_9ROSI|nr:unnamed protein product [Dovyalis caffra]
MPADDLLVSNNVHPGWLSSLSLPVYSSSGEEGLISDLSLFGANRSKQWPKNLFVTKGMSMVHRSVSPINPVSMEFLATEKGE